MILRKQSSFIRPSCSLTFCFSAGVVTQSQNNLPVIAKEVSMSTVKFDFFLTLRFFSLEKEWK